MPTAKTVWTADSDMLAPNQPVTLTWNNGAGLIFERTYAIDNQFMFSVMQTVRNSSGAPVTLFPIWPAFSRRNAGNIRVLYSS